MFTEKKISAVLKVLKTSTQMGKNVIRLENKIARSFEKKYGVMLNSASSALMLIFEALNLPKNSEIITPALTFRTTISSIVKNGYLPALVDVTTDTYCINVDLIEKKINKKTKAICVPNLIGNVPDWKKIRSIAKKYNLIVIENSRTL